MDEYAEDLDLPQLSDWAEEFLAGERAWHRFLRGTGAAASAQAGEQLARWVER